MNESSPFLHRESQDHHHDVRYVREREPDRVAEERARGRFTLERLRFRGYQRAGTLGLVMQRLGDWGREYFPFIGGGWNGIGPRNPE
jgi:hypothetical protein